MTKLNVTWAADRAAMAELAANQVSATLLDGSATSLALPTGDTPIGMYEELSQRCRRGEISFGANKLFNLDEYVGMSPENPRSYHAFMRRNLIDRIDAPEDQVHLLRGDAPDADEQCRAFDRAIEAAGGIDLAVLGLGANGHIAFNEPGVSWDLDTHVVSLDERTRQAHRPNFPDDASVPKTGVTMGINTLRSARKVLLLCAGESKREAMAALLAGREDPAWPVTSLIGHSDLVVVAEEALMPS
jgi:glucosamine-6-phosphate deaminase